MSIDVPTELLTASSGSVGDTVFSRNQHGPYTRDRTSPVDPATALQVAVRAALSECVTAWRTTLTETERSGWDAFALALRTRTALGRSANAGGLGMYVRANVPRIQAASAAVPRVDQAPALYNSAAPTPITRVVLNIVDDTFHPFFDESDAWVTEAQAALLFYASAPRPLTVNFSNGPYRLAGFLRGNDPTLSSPATLPLPVPAGTDQRVFIRGRLTRKDGRLSPAFRLPADIAPQVAPLYTGAVFTPLTPTRSRLTVSFDSPLRREPHAAGSWDWRIFDTLFSPFSAFTDGNTIVLTSFTGPPNIGPDIVRYNDQPIPDVNGLLTGLPVLSFTGFI